VFSVLAVKGWTSNNGLGILLLGMMYELGCLAVGWVIIFQLSRSCIINLCERV